MSMKHSMRTSKTYTIKQLHSVDEIDGKLASFIMEAEIDLQIMTGKKFKFSQFNFGLYFRHAFFWVCYRGSEPVGFSAARRYKSVFDDETRILMQDVLYAIPGGGRAAWLLMQTFVAFGRENADHVITAIHAKTNIKPKSLKKLGFREMETHFRLETGE